MLTYCGDEAVLQTILYHSPFYHNVYDKEDEFESSRRIAVWVENGHLHRSDLTMLLESDYLYARKFEEDDAVALIGEILQRRR